jgi:D-proline reductase (dithiol) PrdB
MTSAEDDALDFAAEHDTPIPYRQRIRDYYLALGYEKPYRWANYVDVPFTPLTKPLSESTVALVTTSAPYQPEKGDQGPGAAYNSAAKFYRVYTDTTDHVPDQRISHIGYDRLHTTAEDMNSWFPLAALHDAAAAGRIGAVSKRFYGAPTNRSQKTTVEQDCVELLERIREDGADTAVIVAT